MKQTGKNTDQNTTVAIIGMGCYFPKSSGLKKYWELLFHGEDAITDIPETHWSAEDYYDKDPKKPDHICCKRGGFLSPVLFDPSEFGIPPSSLESTDTSQILGLVATKMALEDAGYGAKKTFNRDKTSVILGVTGTQELVIPLSSRLGHPKWRKALQDSGVASDTAEEVIERIADSYLPWHENSFPGLLGNVVAGRICNRLDLKGTNCAIDAACGSSLGAIHFSIMELLSGRSDMVVTGGVDTLNDIFMHMCFAKTSVLSPSGDAKPFSEDADGTVLGEGVGILVLKRLTDAQKDGDRIYAVIKAMGSSSDGKSQSVYAPRAEGQEKALRAAYRYANVDPATVELIEAHGTGTPVGDRVEFQALKKVFAEFNKNGNRCALGSVKSMIGHNKAAAGAAGIIKAALALYNKTLLPTLKADKPDPKLGIIDSPFYLCRETRPWFSKNDHPRRSGVSAFGFGGSNFHAVLEEYQETKTEVSWDGSVEIIALSAASQQKLISRLQNFKSKLSSDSSDLTLARIASQSRKDFTIQDPYRLLLVLEKPFNPSTSFNRALESLEANKHPNGWNIGNLYYGGPEKPGKIAFVFPGQGSQYVGMGRDLVCCFPEAFQTLESINKKYEGPHRLTDYIYPYPAQTPKEKQNQEAALRSTDIAQPTIGAVSLAMLNILRAFGIQADATCGHSYGELSALLAADWIDLDTFFHLSIARGKFMAASGKNATENNGAMLAVNAPLDELADLIAAMDIDVVLANRNSPNQGVLSGSVESITQADKICKQRGLRTIQLPVSAAFHSSLVKDAQKPFMQILQNIHILPSNTPVFSNTTGKAYPKNSGTAKKLLGEQILHPVDFVSEIEEIYQFGARTFLEIGPKSVLTGLVKSILKDRNIHAIALDSSAGKRFAVSDLARTLCYLASIGHPVQLEHWEHPVQKTRKQHMHIPVAGANPKPKIKSSAPPVKRLPVNKKTEQPEKYETSKRVAPQPAQSIPMPEFDKNNSHNQAKITLQTFSTSGNKNTMERIDTEKKQKHSDFILDALKVVQEGLKSMQALQMQTAETHKKFLEAQTEAGRTLQEMISSTQRIAQTSIQSFCQSPDNSPAAITTPDAGSNNFDTTASSCSKPIQSEKAPESIDLSSTSQIKAPTSTTLDNIKSDNSNQQEITNSLLAVVSELTGYPVQMLALDMDIEADLGIDSIKRVEILSTLEEKLPNLPNIAPDIMGSLKTLGQITRYLADAADQPSDFQPADTKTESTEKISSAHTDQKEITNTLLAVVSELTGYPVQMLALDMDIEADLGIDSIKRVEILSTLEEKLPNLPNIAPDIMGSLKTLGQIAEYLADPTHSGETTMERTETETADLRRKGSEIASEYIKRNVTKKVVTIVEAPVNNRRKLSIPKGKIVYVTSDENGLSEAIVVELSAQNINAVQITLDAANKPKQNRSSAGGLVILPPVEASDDDTFLKDAFNLSRQMAPELLDSAAKGGAFFATLTRIDGAFGFKGQGFDNPLPGALAGLAKTAAIEWENVCCRAIDIAPHWKANQDIAKSIVNELLNPDPISPVEIGLDADSRCTPVLESAPYSQEHDVRIDLSAKDVVLITGGARGVTAATVQALAKQVQPILVLLGRSPQPIPEPEWLQAIEGEAAIKKAILENQFKGQQTSPKELEHAFRIHTANREISQNLTKLQAAGVSAYYYPVDIRNAALTRLLIDKIRTTHGLIKGIIHGAGVLEDRLIIDKTPEQFENVFDTKVKGLRILLEATRTDHLKYLVLFSSVAARTGNKGQADYAMANEALNKIAQKESIARPNCKVVSINWGPWDGGMVSPALKREFQRNNIDLIPMDIGAECMLSEMAADKTAPVEVVIGANIQPPVFVEPQQSESLSAPKKNNDLKPKEKLSLTFKREIDIDRYPILKSHIIGGKPVVPFALITEWLGHGALHQNPGLILRGLDDIRILNGIKLEEEKKLIRLLAGKARKKGSVYEVEVEVRNGIKNGYSLIHSKAKAILAESPSKPPLFTKSEQLDSNGYSRSIDEVYEDILFHGFKLRGIKSVISCSSAGMVARISTAPSPNDWVIEPLRSKWISDPLVIDCAFQMATLWCFEEMGVVSLPSYGASYRQYRQSYPPEDITAVLEVKEASRHKMKGDFTFLDTHNEVVAQLTGCEAVMDASLFKAFKPHASTSTY